MGKEMNNRRRDAEKKGVRECEIKERRDGKRGVKGGNEDKRKRRRKKQRKGVLRKGRG